MQGQGSDYVAHRNLQLWLEPEESREQCWPPKHTKCGVKNLIFSAYEDSKVQTWLATFNCEPCSASLPKPDSTAKLPAQIKDEESLCPGGKGWLEVVMLAHFEGPEPLGTL
uniref:Uncharacterized protein n=1 Tax=Eutreptiella gymnastica TaxID=73025 RepID=A0A7S4C8F3_9EUGL|mmetsp:Transcript_52565/g.86394  ORF Transcript_52565/g.86394 Transcript_52565/m.86394 type:complete len:111 (+) Transcript_52565:382-714(+)